MVSWLSEDASTLANADVRALKGKVWVICQGWAVE